MVVPTVPDGVVSDPEVVSAPPAVVPAPAGTGAGVPYCATLGCAALDGDRVIDAVGDVGVGPVGCAQTGTDSASPAAMATTDKVR